MRSLGIISILASEIEAAELPVRIFFLPLVRQRANCVFIAAKMGNPEFTKFFI
jgi:hypothetical protein